MWNIVTLQIIHKNKDLTMSSETSDYLKVYDHRMCALNDAHKQI